MLVARHAEMLEMERFIAALSRASPAGPPPLAIVVQGRLGIGKTALWQAGVEAAERAGVRVLRARPSEAEATFAYAALTDLLRDGTAAILERVPRQQREALELALGLSDTSSANGVDAQLVQSAITNAILSAASEGPLLIAIDDAPWLDSPSAAAIQFLARRIGSRPIGLLVTQRVDEENPSPVGLDSAAPDRPVIKLVLDTLSLGALHKLLEQRLSMTLPRPYLLRLHELSDGVPFHALEIARALQRGPLPPIGAPLPIPASLRDLLRDRLSALSPEANRVVLLTAAAGSLPRRTVERIMGEPAGKVAVGSALEAGLLAAADGSLRPAHPLIASTAYGVASRADLLQAHADIASVVAGPEAIARHSALAIDGPDEGVAAALEAAGNRARLRGAPDTAADLFRLALERTLDTDGGARLRRAFELGRALAQGSDLPAAVKVLDELIPQLEAGAPPTAGPLLAQARIIRSEIAWYMETAQDAVAHAEAGLVAAAGDPLVEADLHYRLAIFYNYDAAASIRNSRAAVELLELQDRPSMLASALMVLFAAEVGDGNQPRLELLERAIAVEPPDSRDSTTISGIWWLALDKIDLARARFQHLLDLDRRYGQLNSEPDLLTRLAEVELYADNYAQAREYADSATAAARQQGSETADPSRRIRALIDAHVGLLDVATAAALPAAERAQEDGDLIIAAAWLVVIVFAAASREGHEEVVRMAARSRALLGAIGTREPLRLGVDHEEMESLAALGRVDEAEALIERIEARQRAVPRPWLLAAIARARATLLAAEGRLNDAVIATDDIHAAGATAFRRFDRARTLLVRGALLRRSRERRQSAVALEEALSIFETIGAPVWAARVSAELERLGRRRPGSEDLTPSERQVAELAAGGLTNREVAERLSLSPKTVEAHLARAYAKLGIRSRAELGRLMARRLP